MAHNLFRMKEFAVISNMHKRITIHHPPHHFIKHAKSYHTHLSVVVLCFLIKPDGIVRGMMDSYGTGNSQQMDGIHVH